MTDPNEPVAVALIAALLLGADTIARQIYYTHPQGDGWNPMSLAEAVAEARSLLEHAKPEPPTA